VTFDTDKSLWLVKCKVRNQMILLNLKPSTQEEDGKTTVGSTTARLDE
jgi:hypothetical protein